MFDEALKAELERLRQENAALKKGAAAGISMKKHLFAAAQLVLDSHLLLRSERMNHC
jgi:hypothetical protein